MSLYSRLWWPLSRWPIGAFRSASCKTDRCRRSSGCAGSVYRCRPVHGLCSSANPLPSKARRSKLESERVIPPPISNRAIDRETNPQRPLHRLPDRGPSPRGARRRLGGRRETFFDRKNSEAGGRSRATRRRLQICGSDSLAYPARYIEPCPLNFNFPLQ